ncbi:MAG: Glycine dehydrogenase (decarboxylating) [Ignavibacteria bacterium]|nr:Glycine dehydrogenase (decarboxylating) [Ignavibacteria bacterium]
MSFLPNTDEDRRLMLEQIGVASFDELIKIIPEKVRLKEPLNLPPTLSEYEAVKLMESFANKNITAKSHVCFMGGGAYDRYIPSIVGSVLEKPEFKTAYTPYQAEVSQGTLQAMYEYQSMICTLTGMDISNASLYDGASALAEACLLATAHNNRSEIIISGALNPNYFHVIKSICAGKKITFKNIVAGDGTCDLDTLKTAVGANTSAVILQQPNAYGTIDDAQEIEQITHNAKALFVVSVDPISLGMLAPPGEYNADIVTGEGQALGIPLNFGGPYLGLFACKKEFVRKIPGRLSGITQDLDGNRGFVLTLQTREQQIKREKATSNICTNQGLFMLAATVYLTAMGPAGIREVAEQSFHKAHYLAKKISSIPGFKLPIDKPFFCEFLVETPVAPGEIIAEGEKHGFLSGIDTSAFPHLKPGLLIAVTEKRTKEEMDKFADFLAQFSK